MNSFVHFALVAVGSTSALSAQIFVEAWSQPFQPVTDAALGDVNGDGAPDDAFGVAAGGLIGSRVLPAKFYLRLNEGNGFLPLQHREHLLHTRLRSDCGFYEAGRLHDLDRDGDLDYINVLRNLQDIAGGPPATCNAHAVVFWNDGMGNFTSGDGSRFHNVPAPHIDLPFASDFDGDGDVDLLASGLDPITQRAMTFLLRNDGNEHFWYDPATRRDDIQWSHSNARLADFDGDGLDDAITVSSSQPATVHFNDGTGRFYQGPQLSTGVLFCGVGDIDQDDDADVVLGKMQNVAGQPGLELWLNNGDGTFRLAQERFVNPTWPAANRIGWTHIRLVDVDLDGHTDILDFAGGQNVLYRNDGTDHFVEDQAALGNTRSGYVVHADMDGDGDVDALQKRVGYSAWFPNVTRHLFVNDPPIGGSLDLDIHGDPGSQVGYVLGFARSDIPIPGIGWLRLDPALSAARAANGTVPGGRVLRTSLTVPNDRSLRGVRMFAQPWGIDTRQRLWLGNVATSTIQ